MHAWQNGHAWSSASQMAIISEGVCFVIVVGLFIVAGFCRVVLVFRWEQFINRRICDSSKGLACSVGAWFGFCLLSLKLSHEFGWNGRMAAVPWSFDEVEIYRTSLLWSTSPFIRRWPKGSIVTQEKLYRWCCGGIGVILRVGWCCMARLSCGVRPEFSWPPVGVAGFRVGRYIGGGPCCRSSG
jgi:hypothetical protein